jgi:multiple sugar transport system ATP-binding protein
MADLELKHIEKFYDNGFHAVKDLSLQVNDGEFLVLVGPSGCGKTTALRMIAGLEAISSGELFIGGRLVNDVSPRDRDIAMVFQNYALYPHMTVGENIGFGLALRRAPKAEIQEKVDRAAQLLDLSSLLNRKPKQLSGGQRQRVAMGRAIVRDAQLFLMDEPLSNLDAKLRVQMRTEIAALQQELGTTTVYVTHDQVEAMTMGHRVAVMRLGELLQIAPPQDLYDNPRDVFVAGFIGTPPMTLFHARLEGSPEHATLVIGDQRVTLPADFLTARPALHSYLGRSVITGVRAEDITISEKPEHLPIHAKVVMTEALGPSVNVTFTLSGDPIDEERLGSGLHEVDEEVRGLKRHGGIQGVATLPPRTLASIGSDITLWIDSARIHVFDEDSGLAIR